MCNLCQLSQNSVNFLYSLAKLSEHGSSAKAQPLLAVRGLWGPIQHREPAGAIDNWNSPRAAGTYELQ